MEYTNLQVVCEIIAAITLFIGLMLWPIVYFSVGRQFDKLFKDKQDIYGFFNIGIPVLTQLLRSMCYAICIAFNYTQNTKYYKKMFDGYDFRTYSTRFQIILSSVFIGLIIIGAIASTIATGPQVIQEWIERIKNLLN